MPGRARVDARMRRLDARAAGTRGSTARSGIASRTVMTPINPNVIRQSKDSLRITPTGTPATVASETPPEVNIVARPICPSGARRAATVIDIAQNALSAAPSNRRAMSTATRFGERATMTLETPAAVSYTHLTLPTNREV